MAIENAQKARRPERHPRRFGGRDQTTRNSASAVRIETSGFLEALLALGQLFQDFKTIN